jgi:hypothetical protein
MNFTELSSVWEGIPGTGNHWELANYSYHIGSLIHLIAIY